MRYWHEVLNYQHPEYPSMTVKVSHAAEDMAIGDCFDDSCHDIQDLCDKVNRGIYDWFMVRVEIYYSGSLQGSDYLGGCMYEDADAAIREGLDGYLEDMVDRATAETLTYLSVLRDNLVNDFPQGIPETV